MARIEKRINEEEEKKRRYGMCGLHGKEDKEGVEEERKVI